MGILPITTSISDKLFSCINIDDFEKTLIFQNKGFLLIFAIFGCSAHSERMNCYEMAGDRLAVCEQELL